MCTSQRQGTAGSRHNNISFMNVNMTMAVMWLGAIGHSILSTYVEHFS
jgi:hypothetical protein